MTEIEAAIAWDLPDPFFVDVEVQKEDIDEYDHTNNSVYSKWCDKVAWAHALAVGAGRDAHLEHRRGMAAHKTEMHFLAPTFEGERVRVGNWIVFSDGRFRAHRRYQMVRLTDGITVVRALTQYVCVDLDSGRPRRMPPAYRARYVIEPAVQAALEKEPAPFALRASGIRGHHSANRVAASRRTGHKIGPG